MQENEELDLEIRPAEVDDYDTLTDISRICFPEELRWRARRSHSRKWWDSLINSNNSEVWVCSVLGNIAGFIILTIDREKYEEAMNTQHYSLFDALSIFMHNPKAFYKKILFKIKQRKLKNNLDKKTASDNAQIDTYIRTKNMIKKCIPWCGPIAVLPGICGRGISLKLMKHCCLRAKELGYKEIYTFIAKKNMMPRIMVAIIGFNVIEEIDYRIFYKKSLDTNDEKQSTAAN